MLSLKFHTALDDGIGTFAFRMAAGTLVVAPAAVTGFAVAYALWKTLRLRFRLNGWRAAFPSLLLAFLPFLGAWKLLESPIVVTPEIRQALEDGNSHKEEFFNWLTISYELGKAQSGLLEGIDSVGKQLHLTSRDLIESEQEKADLESAIPPLEEQVAQVMRELEDTRDRLDTHRSRLADSERSLDVYRQLNVEPLALLERSKKRLETALTEQPQDYPQALEAAEQYIAALTGRRMMYASYPSRFQQLRETLDRLEASETADFPNPGSKSEKLSVAREARELGVEAFLARDVSWATLLLAESYRIESQVNGDVDITAEPFLYLLACLATQPDPGILSDILRGFEVQNWVMNTLSERAALAAKISTTPEGEERLRRARSILYHSDARKRFDKMVPSTPSSFL